MLVFTVLEREREDDIWHKLFGMQIYASIYYKILLILPDTSFIKKNNVKKPKRMTIYSLFLVSFVQFL